MTVKVAVALRCPVPPASCAWTVYEPAATEGTLKLHEKVPLDEQVAGDVVTEEAAKVSVIVPARKPAPVTMTLVPTGPDVVPNVIVGLSNLTVTI